MEEFNQNQVDSLNTLLLVDKIFTGRTKEYKIIDGEYKFTEPKTSQEESDITTQQLDEGSDSTDMPDLESKESAAKWRNQQGKGSKILRPNQMLSRLPISLAQLKAGNNSEKLKNEIRQLLYSLYKSKKLRKQPYKSLIDII